MNSAVEFTRYSPQVREQLFEFVQVAAADEDVKRAVEDNHDANRWWPPTIDDWRLRLVVAGWSARISYSMIDTYARVVRETAVVGFDALRAMSAPEIDRLIEPLGLHTARRNYLRSVTEFVDGAESEAAVRELMLNDPDEFIRVFAAQVAYASYKVAQCATLYASGYHCGLIPVDSGMVEKLAACLGWRFHHGAIAHQEMRAVLESAVRDEPGRYSDLIDRLGYRVSIPDNAAPTWWVHLVLIYHKRLYCTYAQPKRCPAQIADQCAPGCRSASRP